MFFVHFDHERYLNAHCLGNCYAGRISVGHFQEQKEGESVCESGKIYTLEIPDQKCQLVISIGLNLNIAIRFLVIFL